MALADLKKLYLDLTRNGTYIPPGSRERAAAILAQITAQDPAWSPEYGTTNATALTGPQGPRGATWLTGHGAPDDSTGIDDDLYLDIDTANVYVKENGSWA